MQLCALANFSIHRLLIENCWGSFLTKYYNYTIIYMELILTSGFIQQAECQCLLFRRQWEKLQIWPVVSLCVTDLLQSTGSLNQILTFDSPTSNDTRGAAYPPNDPATPNHNAAVSLYSNCLCITIYCKTTLWIPAWAFNWLCGVHIVFWRMSIIYIILLYVQWYKCHNVAVTEQMQVSAKWWRYI